MSATHPEDIDYAEQIARVDQLIAQREQLLADRDQKRQSIQCAPWQFAPWQPAIGFMTAGAALFAAGAAFTKIFGA